MKKQHRTDEALAMHVSAVSIFINVALSAFKLLAGLIAHSGAMISDAVHSASDVFSTFIVIAGVRLSGRAADANHRYGHERLECVASILLSVLLALTGVGIGIQGLQKIFHGGAGTLTVPGSLALVAAVVSIVVKEAMYWYTRAAAKQIDSGALMADAWHHRSDALSSIGSFIGVLGARMGYPVLDPVASVVICLFIIKAAYDIFVDAVRKMTDESCDEETVQAIEAVVRAQPGVLGVDEIKTRLFGPKIYVDVEICADGERTLNETHAVAEGVHLAIEQSFPNVKHCMVHVNPAKTAS
ncbi:MAG: cation diffusion facilitator family transporter [Butyricicoccus sp.]|nr:cation diffusion facilitator family transporter [Clostridiales bacterium]MDY5971894.1 cation diffusion facilitator family transporter [Butyricicoccus sp.]